jgi:HSP20 family protein
MSDHVCHVALSAFDVSLGKTMARRLPTNLDAGQTNAKRTSVLLIEPLDVYQCGLGSSAQEKKKLWRCAMAETVTKMPIRQERTRSSPALPTWRPFESLRDEIDHIFDDFGRGLWQPFGRPLFSGEAPLRRSPIQATMPAVDVVESEKSYEITAELPGMDEKNIEVRMADGILTIKGEKQEEKEEKKKGYYLQERHFGSFERSFEVPESVDADRIDASFKKGVLTLTLPKKVEAQKPAKKIEVKAN